MEEFIVKKIDRDDEDFFNEFIFEHVVYGEERLVCDNSLITNKQYINYSSFKKWYEINKLIEEYKYSSERVKAFTYLLYQKKDERLRLMSVFEIRFNLTPNTEKYGNISINIRPSERNKGYYSRSLRCALALTKELNLDKVTLVISKKDLRGKRAIEDNFVDYLFQEENDNYIYTFYNKKVCEKLNNDYFDNDNSFIYIGSEQLFYNTVSKDITGYNNIMDSLNDLFSKEIPFGYIYVLDKQSFNDDNVLIKDAEPYEIVKVTYEQFLEIKENKKLIK